MSTAQQDVRRIAALLQAKIQERKLAPRKIEETLGWVRGDVRRLLSLKKEPLTIETALQILEVIGVEPAKFFAEVFAWPDGGGSDSQAIPTADPAGEPKISPKLGHLRSTLNGLVRLLVEADLIAANESAAILDRHRERNARAG